MAQGTKRATYPLGRATPGMRLRATAKRVQRGLEQAKAPGLAELKERWTDADPFVAPRRQENIGNALGHGSATLVVARRPALRPPASPGGG